MPETLETLEDRAERLRARRDSIGRDLSRAYTFGTVEDAARLERAYRKASDVLFDADQDVATTMKEA